MERIPWGAAVRRPQLSLMNSPDLRRVAAPQSAKTPPGGGRPPLDPQRRLGSPIPFCDFCTPGVHPDRVGATVALLPARSDLVGGLPFASLCMYEFDPAPNRRHFFA